MKMIFIVRILYFESWINQINVEEYSNEIN